jgi:hypothetical protein
MAIDHWPLASWSFHIELQNMSCDGLLDAVRRGCVEEVVQLLSDTVHLDLEHVGCSESQMRVWDKETPLLAAVRRRHVAIVRLLLDAGASVALKDMGLIETTPLHRALEDSSPCLPIVRMLLDAGVDLNAIDHEARPPLFVAIEQHHDHALFAQLLMAGADVSRFCDGKTVLHVTETSDWPLLLAAGADPSALSLASRRRGPARSPMMLAVSRADRIGVLLLVAAGAPRTDLCELDAPGIAAAKKAIHLAGFHAIRARMFEICVALQDLELPAPLLTEIAECACAPFASQLPYHFLWDVAVCVKRTHARPKTFDSTPGA